MQDLLCWVAPPPQALEGPLRAIRSGRAWGTCQPAGAQSEGVSHPERAPHYTTLLQNMFTGSPIFESSGSHQPSQVSQYPEPLQRGQG